MEDKTKFFLLIMILAISCARRGALTGGPPDNTAPEIIESFPKSDTANIADLRRFYFKFSEKVDKYSFEEHVYIQPFSEKRLLFEWNGWKEVWITLPDTLLPNKTYQLFIAKGFTDLHRIRSEKEFKIAFTTKGHLDQAVLSGKISYLGRTLKQIRIALFKEKGFNKLASYVADVSSGNKFKLNHLKAGNYRALFFNDKNSNFKIDLVDEEVAILSHEIIIDSVDYFSEDLFFSKFDTIPPIFDKVDTLFRGVIRITFNEKINLKKSKLILRDASNRIVNFKFVFRDKFKSVVGYFKTDSLNYPLHLEVNKVFDLSGNSTKNRVLSNEIPESFHRDTSDFKISKVSLKDSVELVSLKFDAILELSMDFDLKKQNFLDFTLKKISKNKKLNIPIKVEQTKSNELYVYTRVELEPSSRYIFKASYRGVKNMYQKELKDTTMFFRLFTPSRNKYGDLFFRVRHSKVDSLVIQIYNIKFTKNPSRELTIATNKDVMIRSLKSGRYRINLFHDRNKNGKHDLGRMRPFKISEPFYIYSDTISLRSNWEKNIGEIKLESPF